MTDLRALALAATPGPWHWHQQPDGLTGCGRNWWVESDDEADIGDMQRYADAAYIAAASPAVVLALLDVVEAAGGRPMAMPRRDRPLRVGLAGAGGQPRRLVGSLPGSTRIQVREVRAARRGLAPRPHAAGPLRDRLRGEVRRAVRGVGVLAAEQVVVTMTPEDLAAIRARDAQPFGANDLPAIQLWRDRRALLTALDEANAECAQARAEVDRLTALVNDEALLVMRGHAMVQEAERARLRAAVEGLPGARVFGPAYGTASSIETDARLVRRAAVLAIVEGTDGRE